MSRCTPVSKKSKCQDNDDIDLISKLPQSVICHILSRLPSKDVVRTSILSKDWVYKWISSYNIDIDDTGANTKKRTNFMNFVDRILRPSHDLKRFRFLCHYKHGSTRLAAWISTALRRNTESFELQLPQGFELPRSLITNTALREFKVVLFIPLSNRKPLTSIIFKVTPDNYFPNLTYLYLDRIEFHNDQSDSSHLVFTFPALKTLELLSCNWSNAKFVEIHSPVLSTFTFKCSNYEGGSSCSIKICGARLTKFASYGAFSDNIIMYESTVLNAALMNSLLSGRLQVLDSLQVRKLLKGLSSVTDLHLSSCVCKAVGQSKQDLLPEFDRLQRLVLSIDNNVKLLVELLHSAPSLKFLEIEILKPFAVDCYEVDHVPYCIVSHLEEVKIKYRGREEKVSIHLAKFLLKNGLVLKKLLLHDECSQNSSFQWQGRYSKAEVVEQLLAVPRASASVGIAVY